MESQNQQTQQQPSEGIDIGALRAEIQQAEREHVQPEGQKQEQPSLKDALSEVGSASAEALASSLSQEQAPQGQPSKEQPPSQTPTSQEQLKKAQEPPKEQVREVYQYIHPELVKQSTAYRELASQAAAVDALANTIKEQLALAHEGKPVKLVKSITPDGKIVFTEEHVPTGADLVELQRQYNLATTFKANIDQHIQALEQNAQRDYSIVDEMLKLADAQVFSKLDFSKGRLGEVYTKLISAVPRHINDIPVFNSYLRLLALNEVMAQELVAKKTYNNVMNTAAQHAGPGPAERQVSQDEAKLIEERFASILGR